MKRSHRLKEEKKVLAQVPTVFTMAKNKDSIQAQNIAMIQLDFL